MNRSIKNPNDYTTVGKYVINNPCSQPGSICSKFYKQFPELNKGDVVENYCGNGACPDRNHVNMQHYNESNPCRLPGSVCGNFQRNLKNYGEKLFNN